MRWCCGRFSPCRVSPARWIRERADALCVRCPRDAIAHGSGSPAARLELLGRFEGVVEVRADAGVRIDNWSIDDAMGDSMLVTVLDANPLEREFGDWYGRYEVIVEPLVDGQVTVGPLMLTYLVDPDPEATRRNYSRERATDVGLSRIEVASPGRGPTPAAAKDPVEADRAFAWRSVLMWRVGRCGRAGGDGAGAGGSFDDARRRATPAGMPGRSSRRWNGWRARMV